MAKNDHAQLAIIFGLIFFNFNVLALPEKADSNRFFNFGFNYYGDAGANLRGGIKTGGFYLGWVNTDLTIHLWKESSFLISLGNTHGNQPSIEMLGDYQYASGIEAGNHTFLYELWFRQGFGIGDVTIGLQEVNSEFAFTDYGTLFLNSSFGLPPSISCNFTAPTFPLTTPGITTRWFLSPKTTFKLAAFDGVPTDFRNNPHNLKWEISKKDGLFIFSEIQRTIQTGPLTGTLKGGFYFHEHFSFNDTITPDNHGFYVIADQEIWKNEASRKNLGCFLQFGYCPEYLNDHSYYIGTGIHYAGAFKKNGSDIAGIGLAHALFNDAGHETALELSYLYPFCRYFFVQPDIQYIINPSGTAENLNNCIVLFLRIGLSL